MLLGKNIVITDCLQEIGKETLIKFAKNRANIFACVCEKNEEFRLFCEDLAKKNGVKIIPVYYDVADIFMIEEAVKTIQESKMEIHGIVNIAETKEDAFWGTISYEDMINIFQVNVYSPIFLSQHIVKLMQKNRTKGSVVFTSNIIALDGSAGQVTYGASKAALLGAMKSMALELGESGVRVNAVCLGVIKTSITEKLTSEEIESKEKMMEIPRLGEASEVADVFMYLMSDLSTHLSGQTIRVDGGIG